MAQAPVLPRGFELPLTFEVPGAHPRALLCEPDGVGATLAARRPGHEHRSHADPVEECPRRIGQGEAAGEADLVVERLQGGTLAVGVGVYTAFGIGIRWPSD